MIVLSGKPMKLELSESTEKGIVWIYPPPRMQSSQMKVYKVCKDSLLKM